MFQKTALLLLFVLLHPSDILAQDMRNRTEEMYRFGRVIIATEPLPDKVYEAQKRKFVISVIFSEKGTNNEIISGIGTGFTTDQPGVIITARHLLSETIRDMDVLKAERIKTNPGFDYTYTFKGTIITRDSWIDFPLTLAAAGEAGTLKDMMALKVGIRTIEQALISGDIKSPNPLGILMRTFEFADASLGEKVFISGYAPILTQLPDKNNNITSIYVDLINFTSPAEITAKIEGMPVNKNGISLMYRMRDGAEPGYSGGLVMNAKGQVVGIISAMSKNFVYAISSKDIKNFLKDNELR